MVASKEANRITRLEKMVKNQKEKLIQLDKDRLELEEIGFQKAVKEDEIRKTTQKNEDHTSSTGNKAIESKKELQELMVKEYDQMMKYNETVLQLEGQGKRVKNLKRNIGRYQQRKRVCDGLKFNRAMEIDSDVVVSTKIRVYYIINCFTNSIIESLFIYFLYQLQLIQNQDVFGRSQYLPDLNTDFLRDHRFYGITWTVPEKYICDTTTNKHDIFGLQEIMLRGELKSFHQSNGRMGHRVDRTEEQNYLNANPCHQQFEVVCWVSRSFEKTLMLRYGFGVVSRFT